MYELFPYFTNDGSVGLYSPKDDDIYHSTYGALSEAYEKFILPANLNEFLVHSVFFLNSLKKFIILRRGEFIPSVCSFIEAEVFIERVV